MTERKELQDKALTCVDCKQEFTWAAGEQEYFREMGLTNDPKRCKDCRQSKNQRRAEQETRKGAGA